MKLSLLLIWVDCLLVHLPANAQSPDSSINSYTAALTVYHSLLMPEAGLYKGNEYIDYSTTIQEGSLFFDPVPFQTGSVMYHQIFYEGVFIAYDVVSDNVIIYDASHLHKLSLIKDQVSHFTTSGRLFTHLTKDSAGASRMKSGFYEVLYEGTLKVLKKETRSVQERSTIRGTLEHYIIGSANYFIEKGGVYYLVNNKSSFLSVVKDKQKELQQFIRKKRMKFRTNKDVEFAQAAAYYDTLSK